MTVRQSLLAILDRGDCYGSQLRSEYLRRTGVAVNVGQVYTTLERLERDGLVEHRGVDDEGRVLWGSTPAGRAEARSWLGDASLTERRDEVALRIALALTLPGADVHRMIAAQRAAVEEALGSVEPTDENMDAVARAVVASARRARLEADLRFLDDVERLAEDAVPFGLSAERPRRGRPVRASR
ncbi:MULTISPECIES: PadR family transcriptional regulator [Microbacterium]|jgi:DNA-binding PadR family transcriptional regulator|uniref:PadR family transcriptional regulator n=1 Tax=Microbacterium TaxID=33882 RepID=UPI001D1723C1|nr:helix-turn-helix transcriptional regulator [Microbacterium testaceum]MCC4249942.1 PadR family transcriptional regulator [Microbacterium testaceum]